MAARVERAWTWLVGWFLCTVVACLHLGVLAMVAGSTGPSVVLYLLPAVATVVCRRTALRHWWRFVALYSLNLVAAAGLSLPVFLVAEVWVFHQSWVAEHDPADRALRPTWLPSPALMAAGRRALSSRLGVRRSV